MTTRPVAPEAAPPRFTRSPWKLADGSRIQLITPAELATLAPGTVLRCIDGTNAVVGKDTIDDDTRYGYLAFGFDESAEAVPPRATTPEPKYLDYEKTLHWLTMNENLHGLTRDIVRKSIALTLAPFVVELGSPSRDSGALVEALHDAVARCALSGGREERWVEVRACRAALFGHLSTLERDAARYDVLRSALAMCSIGPYGPWYPSGVFLDERRTMPSLDEYADAAIAAGSPAEEPTTTETE